MHSELFENGIYIYLSMYIFFLPIKSLTIFKEKCEYNNNEHTMPLFLKYK